LAPTAKLQTSTMATSSPCTEASPRPGIQCSRSALCLRTAYPHQSSSERGESQRPAAAKADHARNERT
jgi:hypothetical protein